MLRTDRSAFLWLDRVRDDRTKLARWAILLQEFTFNVVHCRESTNELPTQQKPPLQNQIQRDRFHPPQAQKDNGAHRIVSLGSS